MFYLERNFVFALVTTWDTEGPAHIASISSAATVKRKPEIPEKILWKEIAFILDRNIHQGRNRNHSNYFDFKPEDENGCKTVMQTVAWQDLSTMF